MSYRFWLIVVIAAALVGGVLFHVVQRKLQDRDFKRQVEGKRPIRTAPEETRRTADQAPNTELDIALAATRARRLQDSIGPK